MPDWSYHPIFRPLLFHLPAEQARDLTFSALGTLAALPLGLQAIELLGQMTPPSTLQLTAWGITFPGPLGLGAGLDLHADALPALACFGFGFLEAGPASIAPVPSTRPVTRQAEHHAIWYPEPLVNDGIDVLMTRLRRSTDRRVPIGVRLGYMPGASLDDITRERTNLIEWLHPYADFFTLEMLPDAYLTPATWRQHLAALVHALHTSAPPRPVLVCLRPDLDEAIANQLIPIALEYGITGIVVTGGIRAPQGGRLVGAPARECSLRMVRTIHARWRDQVTIIGSGGVEEPADALRLLEAGATFVQVHSGLVYAGPGLAKRINEAIDYYHPRPNMATVQVSNTHATNAYQGNGQWIWIGLLGLSMVLGGLLAWLIAITRVVLPYDELFVGLARSQLAALNPHLLAFMAHDRISLAGTMISIGVLYGSLAAYGIRAGMHWARRAIGISATVGFTSFFLFLGFGYFDPLHALVSLLLLPLFLLGMRGQIRRTAGNRPPNTSNDRAWLLGVWGQLCFVLMGAGLILAGIAITVVGVTSVLVHEDSIFLQATPEALRALNPHLLALIAHDRAGFGGALVADGLAVLLTALWGFRQHARWLWWMFLAAGVPGFLATIGVHFSIGYLEPGHLFPALLAALVYCIGLVLSYPYLCAGTVSYKHADQRRVERAPQ